MTATELAARLGLAARDVRQAAARGEIPYLRVGESGLLFDQLAVVRALRGQLDHGDELVSERERDVAN